MAFKTGTMSRKKKRKHCLSSNLPINSLLVKSVSGILFSVFLFEKFESLKKYRARIQHRPVSAVHFVLLFIFFPRIFIELD